MDMYTSQYTLTHIHTYIKDRKKKEVQIYIKIFRMLGTVKNRIE